MSPKCGWNEEQKRNNHLFCRIKHTDQQKTDGPPFAGNRIREAKDYPLLPLAAQIQPRNQLENRKFHLARNGKTMMTHQD